MFGFYYRQDPQEMQPPTEGITPDHGEFNRPRIGGESLAGLQHRMKGMFLPLDGGVVHQVMLSAPRARLAQQPRD